MNRRQQMQRNNLGGAAARAAYESQQNMDMAYAEESPAQMYVQEIRDRVLDMFRFFKQTMPNQEVYAVSLNIDEGGNPTIQQVMPITDKMNSGLHLELPSAKNNDEINLLIIFNNTIDTQQTNFCMNANLGQDKGFALLQVSNLDQRDASTSGQLLVSLNQNINIKENFKLTLQENDFIVVALSSLGLKENSKDSVVSLNFGSNKYSDYTLAAYAVVAILLLIALIYVIYLCTKGDGKKAKTSLAPAPAPADGVSPAFFFF